MSQRHACAGANPGHRAAGACSPLSDDGATSAGRYHQAAAIAEPGASRLPRRRDLGPRLRGGDVRGEASASNKRHSRAGGNPGHGATGACSPLSDAGPTSARSLSPSSCCRGARRQPTYLGDVTWAPACAGVTFAVRQALPTNVIPAQAGTQDTGQRGRALHWSDGGRTQHIAPDARRARGMGRRGERGADAWLTWRETRHPRSTAAGRGFRARRTVRPFPSLVVLSRGRPAMGATTLQPPARTIGKRVDSAPLVEPGWTQVSPMARLRGLGQSGLTATNRSRRRDLDPACAGNDVSAEAHGIGSASCSFSTRLPSVSCSTSLTR